MKKIILVSVAILLASNITFAKKIKFSVDMTGIAISPFGMHISGDFQTLAGFSGGDWMPNNTPLTQEISDTNIYSIVVDIPAFAKYEYKFVNGDQFYEAEFVPEESRVGYNFNDSRWIYLDSLADDTTFVGAILFGGNAPANLNLARFYVNMQNEVVSTNGVHVAGDFQSWSPTKSRMYHFNEALNGIYEIIEYVTPNTYQYKYYNGNSLSDSETILGGCDVGGNRSITISADIMLSIVCFTSCNDCATSTDELVEKSLIKIYPNPTTNVAIIQFKNNDQKTVVMTDLNGKIVQEYNTFDSTLQIQKNNLKAGIYFVNVQYADNSYAKEKLIFQ